MQEPVEIITAPAHFVRGAYVEARTLKIYWDDDPMNPRTEIDNFGHMVCYHRRYELGDVEASERIGDFVGWAGLETLLRTEHGAAVIIPLYMYDHSGITIRTSPFGDRWDSGQVGYIYCTRQDILDNWGEKRITAERLAHARKLLQAEVEEYDDYLTGNVYGYVLEDGNGEPLDSRWGYYGDDAVAVIKAELHMQKSDCLESSTKPVVV